MRRGRESVFSGEEKTCGRIYGRWEERENTWQEVKEIQNDKGRRLDERGKVVIERG